MLLILQRDQARPRAELVAAVRTVLGFSRTGTLLEDRIGQAIEALASAGKVVR